MGVRLMNLAEGQSLVAIARNAESGVGDSADGDSAEDDSADGDSADGASDAAVELRSAEAGPGAPQAEDH
jgi:DNA gyrase subunit A